MKTFDVWLSYPIKVNAEDEDHVREIIMANEHLRNAPDLKLEIKEILNES